MLHTRCLFEGVPDRSESDLLVFISSVMTDELEWARTEARQTFKDCSIARPWAFEFTPASSEPATDAYLRKIGDADFVVWLVGSQTTQPVVDEINTTIATGRRLLVFKLPADDRDALTQQLLCTASKYCKWQTITKQTPLREALAASIRDEFIRALRDPPPARRRTLEQWRDLSVAKCRQSWITLGVPPDLATELANDRSVGDVLAAEDVSLQVVIAEAGAGKSLAASRFFQHAIQNALQDGTKPFPIFVNARDLSEPLDEYLDRRTEGLVHPSYQPTLIVVDGLDERGVTQANELIFQIQCYVEAHPESRLLATSRPLPGLKLPHQQSQIRALADEEVAALIGRIAGTTLRHIDLYSWTDSVRTAARRPLFAVLIGAELRQRPTMRFDQPVDLINRLAQHVVEKSRHQGARVNELLQKLAVRAISSGRRVRKSEVTRSHAEHRLLADSGLLDASETTVDFNHEVLREWYAARALVEDSVPIDEVVPGSDRWMTPFKLVLDSDNWDARNALRHKLASSDPGLASLLIKETSRHRAEADVSNGPTELADQLGEDLWKAMDSWRQGLGELFQMIGPATADGGTAAVGIHKNATTITTSWYRGAETVPRVVSFSEDWSRDYRNLEAGWAVLHTETTPPGDAWPWRATRRYLLDGLSQTILTRRLALFSPHAVRELVWAFSLALTNQSEFNTKRIRVREVLDRVKELARHAQATIAFKIGRLEVTPDELGLITSTLERLLEHGADIAGDPWPSFDQPPSGGRRGLRTWDLYSRDRLLERANAVYSVALQLYADMVDRWFGRFRSRLRFGRLFPLKLEGRLNTSHQPDWEGAPSLSWRARALPEGETSQVALEWGSGEDFDLFSYWKEEEDNLKLVRPGTDATPCPITGDPLPSIDSIRPVTDLVHSWLIGDLRELGWTDLSPLSLLR